MKKASYCIGLLGLVAGLGLAAPLAATPAQADLYITRDNPSRVINSHDRIILRDFLARDRASTCSFENGESKFRPEPCDTPSRVIRFYPRGEILPQNLIYETLPQYVESRITPPGNGQAYVYAGDNIYLMDAMTHRVLDSVSIASE